MRAFLRRFRIFPLLVLVAGLSFSVRVGEFFGDLSHMGQAYAQEQVDVSVPDMPGERDKSKADHGDDHGNAAKKMSDSPQAKPASPMDSDSGVSIDWKDANEFGVEVSDVEPTLYEDLVSRRQSLEERERHFEQREALLRAAERQLEQKTRELTAVRDEIKALLERQKEEEQGRITSLVKIYEGMKAKDAARIFNTLDLDVLVAVVSRMSERKSAPILAEMSAERARTVTIMLAEEKTLPSLPN